MYELDRCRTASEVPTLTATLHLTTPPLYAYNEMGGRNPTTKLRAASLELTAPVLPICYSSSIVGGTLISPSSLSRILSLLVMLRWMPPVDDPDVTEEIQV